MHFLTMLTSPSSSMYTLVTPYMVVGRCIVRSGVGLRGDVGPNAPIVLGQNNIRLCLAHTSTMFWKPVALTCNK